MLWHISPCRFGHGAAAYNSHFQEWTFAAVWSAAHIDGVETSWLMRLLPDAAPSCCMLELCCCCRSPSRSMASYTCLRGRVLTRASSLTMGSAARPSSDGQALLTCHSSSSRTCSCSLAELQASTPLHLRGTAEVANTRVAFCRNFRITIQIGTCACHAVRCVLHSTARLGI